MTTTRSPIPETDLYRFEYTIDLDLDHTDRRGRLLVVMKNPSYPDERNVCFAKAAAWARQRDFGAVDFANLFARRAYDPRELNALDYDDAVGAHNDYMISMLASDADLVIAAWGQSSGIRSAWYARRVREVVDVIGADRLTALDTTTAGHPKHPQVWCNRWTPSEWSVRGLRS